VTWGDSYQTSYGWQPDNQHVYSARFETISPSLRLFWTQFCSFPCNWIPTPAGFKPAPVWPIACLSGVAILTICHHKSRRNAKGTPQERVQLCLHFQVTGMAAATATATVTTTLTGVPSSGSPTKSTAQVATRGTDTGRTRILIISAPPRFGSSKPRFGSSKCRYSPSVGLDGVPWMDIVGTVSIEAACGSILRKNGFIA
jgi:hypothetical protein